MASIHQIEVANFLCEDYDISKDWVPLYRGVTFRLFGQSTAFQIDNGGGKTSLSDGCLYLLSRDRRLKPKVEDRVAPADKGWTHIRIEFIEKPLDENILQSELITLTPEEAPGVTYVIGLCWSRNKEPLFYRYQGTLADAPCYTASENRLELISNEAFRKSVDRMPGSQWNRWGNIAEWHEEIRQFTNMDIIKQNVEFQHAGAGDYSAMITKVKKRGIERWDEAFFRELIAPELLRQPVGEDGDMDDAKFESTLLRTLKPTAAALVDIARAKADLNNVENALHAFATVEEKAEAVVKANEENIDAMNAVKADASVIYNLAVRSPLPGVPIIPAGAPWLKDKRLVDVLANMVIDKEHGVLITDTGLNILTNVQTSEINRRGENSKVATSQLIDLKHHLKDFCHKPEASPVAPDVAQPIDSKHHLKESGRGAHRKYQFLGYRVEAALDVVHSVRHLAGATTIGAEDLLRQAFGIAAEIDTNPYRREATQLNASNFKHESESKKLTDAVNALGTQIESLEKEQTEAKENELAYQDFQAKGHYYPEELRLEPQKAKNWAEETRETAQGDLNNHNLKVGELKPGFNSWNTLVAHHGITPLNVALKALDDDYSSAETQHKQAKGELNQSTQSLSYKQDELSKNAKNTSVLETRANQLELMKGFEPTYRTIFGDADPQVLDPTASLKVANLALQTAASNLVTAKLACEALDNDADARALYVECFGTADPVKVNPANTLKNLTEAIGLQNETLAQYQEGEEALQLFEDEHPSVSPKQWLADIGKQREVLQVQDRLAETAITDVQQEIADMEAFAVADDRVYSNALKTLSTVGIRFSRLHEVLAEGATGTRLAQCLTLFSSALSAPVVVSLEDADKATEMLERKKQTVPVFLKDGLLQFVREGGLAASGDLVHTYFVGRKTRQVEILLNPGLLEEEKTRAANEIKQRELERIELVRQLKAIATDSPGVLLATKADDAIHRGAREACRNAMAILADLKPGLSAATRNAESDAMASIEAMKRYLVAGGAAAYGVLVSKTIPDLELARAACQEKVDLLDAQTTSEASEALLNMRHFKEQGGDKTLENAREALSSHNEALARLENEISKLSAVIADTLKPAANMAEQQFTEIGSERSKSRQALAQAIEFEKSGDLDFMRAKQNVREEITVRITSMQQAMENIDFERAQRYATNATSGDKSFAERTGELKSQKDKEQRKLKEVRAAIAQVEIRLAMIKPLIGPVHQVAFDLMGRLAQLSTLPDSIRTQLQSGLPSDIREFVAAVTVAALGDQPGTSEEVLQAWHNLYQIIEEIVIDEKSISASAEKLKNAKGSFNNERNYYCKRARNGEIKGLNALEIECIENAKTIDEIRKFRELKDVIQKQIDDLSGDLDTLTAAMETNRSATVENLSKFAMQAVENKKILDRVMSKHPGARFDISCDVANEERIKAIIESLIREIEDREKLLRDSKASLSNADIQERDLEYKELIHRKIYSGIFSGTKVEFVHDAIRPTKTLFTEPGERLSTGQHTALAMMWLVRHAEYVQTRVAMMHGTRREQKQALRGSQRIMFFDGLFSNLSNESYINAAFHGLKDVGDNFQLIGLIHNPYYVNNPLIFPTHLIGKRVHGQTSDRTFMAFKPWQADNGMVFATTALRQNESVHA